MWTALLWKELRECSLYAAFALLVMLHVIGEGMNLPLVAWMSNGRQMEIPLLSGTRENVFTTIVGLVAVVCGFHQTLWESFRQTTLFLLHRPAPRTQIFLGKLAAGGIILLVVGAIPLLIYCLWAAYPGTHASPFAWSMSESWWRSLVMAAVCYLGAFFAGLRPARWIGSRLLPLVATVAIAQFCKHGFSSLFWPYFYFLLLSAGLMVLILNEARVREYP
jgi:ABC-2 family transporter protein